jgi:hypothetical protein
MLCALLMAPAHSCHAWPSGTTCDVFPSTRCHVLTSPPALLPILPCLNHFHPFSPAHLPYLQLPALRGHGDHRDERLPYAQVRPYRRAGPAGAHQQGVSSGRGQQVLPRQARRRHSVQQRLSSRSRSSHISAGDACAGKQGVSPSSRRQRAGA